METVIETQWYWNPEDRIAFFANRLEELIEFDARPDRDRFERIKFWRFYYISGLQNVVTIGTFF